MRLEMLLRGSFYDWIPYAKSDLDLADIEKTEYVSWENLCFHAQQAAENSLKALLVFKNIGIPITHNPGIRLDLIPADMNVPEDAEDAAILSDYAVTSRYPRDYPLCRRQNMKKRFNSQKLFMIAFFNYSSHGII